MVIFPFFPVGTYDSQVASSVHWQDCFSESKKVFLLLWNCCQIALITKMSLFIKDKMTVFMNFLNFLSELLFQTVLQWFYNTLS